MTPPKARCVTCNTVIQSHDPTKTNQRPKFCEDPQCKAIYKKNPVCVRCHNPLGETKSGIRYHEECRWGCQYCGKPFPMPPRELRREIKRKDTLLPTYCSKECRNNAWADQPMPTCPTCEQPVTFTAENIWRDPPAYHHGCRPDSRRMRKQWYTEHAVERAQFAVAYNNRHKALYQPFDPRFTPPRPPHVPQDLAFMCADPDLEDHDDEPTGGSMALECDILDVHPDKPLRERADVYTEPWSYQDDEWLGHNPYMGKYVPLTPWADENGVRMLNPVHNI